jgi:hypothetical protein
MNQQPDDDDAPDLGEGTDIAAEQSPEPAPEDKAPTSDAERFREEGDTQGGTGGLDAGGAG